MGSVDKDFTEARLNRNYAMQEISDLLRKRNQNVRGFLCVRSSVFAKVTTFPQGKLLIWNSRIL